MGEDTRCAGTGGFDEGGRGWENLRSGILGWPKDTDTSLVAARDIDESRIGMGGGVGDFFSVRGEMGGRF